MSPKVEWRIKACDSPEELETELNRLSDDGFVLYHVFDGNGPEWKTMIVASREAPEPSDREKKLESYLESTMGAHWEREVERYLGIKEPNHDRQPNDPAG